MMMSYQRRIVAACIATVVVLYLLNTAGAEFRRVCYFTNWSQYGTPAFLPANIDPTLCSHVLFAFANIVGNQLTAIEWNDETLYQQVNNLKSINPGLKTLLSIGGYSAGQSWSSMLSTSSNRQQFTSSSITFLRERNFDGLDLDFEYPGTGTSPPGDKQLYTTLVQGLRTAFNSEGVATSRAALLLTAAVGSGKWSIDAAYNVPAISQAMDFIIIMSYDYHGTWKNFTGHNAPLFPLKTDTGSAVQLNVRWSAQYWVSLGAPSNKLVIGIPFYGRCFTLSSAARGFGAPISGPCSAGEMQKYNKICPLLASGSTSRIWSTEQQVPYLIYNSNQWLGYDDAQSVALKANWSHSNGYGGWMIWSLDQDDFTGSACGGQRYPLLKALNSAINASTAPIIKSTTTTTAAKPPTTKKNVPVVISKTTTKPKTTKRVTSKSVTKAATKTTKRSTTRPRTATTIKPSTSTRRAISTIATTPSTTTKMTTRSTTTGTFTCTGKSNGYYASPANCTEFYQCVAGNAYRFECPSGLYYDDVSAQCNWSYALTDSRRRQCQLA